MAPFAVNLVMAATAGAGAMAVGAYCRLFPNRLEIPQRYNEEAKELCRDEKRVPRKSSRGLVFAPEFDGLHCYENIICRDEKRVPRKSSTGLVFAPEFDGLHYYENIISG